MKASVAAELVASLHRAGLVEIWPESPEGASLTLSALAAERHRVKIDPVKRRWVDAAVDL